MGRAARFRVTRARRVPKVARGGRDFPPSGLTPTMRRVSIRSGFVDAVGHTPLIRLKRASEQTDCEIYGKAEFLNPGGSIKDRAARSIVLAAERDKRLGPGGVIVEGTGGNTGIGLTLVAKARGYRTVIVIPETQSQEKKDALRIFGADLREAPAVAFADPRHYVHTAERIAAELAKTEPGGVLYADQWDNPANRAAHYEETGPEIWEQCGGKIDGFICAMGTGGTLSGVGLALKERNRSVQIGLADPGGSALRSYFDRGVLEGEGSSIMEGIGLGRATKNVEGAPVDHPYRINDDEALRAIFELLEHEGLCVGGSSGINVAGAIRLAKELGPGHTIVTMLCDHGQRYQSKLFNPAFLREKNLPIPEWLEG